MATFSGPTTFPSYHTTLDYADSHAHVMAAIADLHIVSYNIAFAKDGPVLLKYTAEGNHSRKAHVWIEALGRKARWNAAALFEVKDGKVEGL